jgi:LAS superfamily LD-carboxypeptidase LdcB
MRQAAKSAGVELWMTGSYRSYEGQVSCARRKGTSDQNQWLIQNNEPIPPVALPNGWCAVPGRSNHGWGLAIDIGHDSYPCSQGSPCWLWMIDNAQRYGWCDTGGGPREPWHWQYVGSGKCSGLFGSKPPR